MALRISEEEYTTLQARTGAVSSVVTPSPSVKKNKYNAKKKEVDGHVFDSTAEAKRYMELKALAQAGEIAELMTQMNFRLTVNGVHIATYRADFTYKQHGRMVVEDVKGYRTREYRMKKALMFALWNVAILETTPRR